MVAMGREKDRCKKLQKEKNKRAWFIKNSEKKIKINIQVLKSDSTFSLTSQIINV